MFLKEYLEKVNFEKKKSADDKNMKNYPACKKLLDHMEYFGTKFYGLFHFFLFYYLQFLLHGLVVLVTGLDKQKKIQSKIVNIFLPIIFNICFGCSKERFF